MKGIAKLIMALGSLRIVEIIMTLDYKPISKEHVGEVRVIYQ
jgi:hypothetical protein